MKVIIDGTIDEIIIGGVPTYDEVITELETPNAAAAVEDLGLDYGDLKQGKTGAFWEKKVKEAGQLMKEQKDTYEYVLATASNTTGSTINWSDYPNFTQNEFECNCGCGFDDINEEVVMVLQTMREQYGKPIRVRSACRCLKHNREIGSEDTSSHIKGDAVDVDTPTSNARLELTRIAFNCGIKRLGVYDNNFIHIDVDHSKPDAMWVN